MSGLFLLMCALAYFGGTNEKLSAFALQAAAGLLGCLLTLVTGRRPAAPDTLMDPAVTKSSVVSTVESTSEPPKP